MILKRIQCPVCKIVVPMEALPADPWDEDRYELLGRIVKLDWTDMWAHLWTHEPELRKAAEKV